MLLRSVRSMLIVFFFFFFHYKQKWSCVLYLLNTIITLVEATTNKLFTDIRKTICSKKINPKLAQKKIEEKHYSKLYYLITVSDFQSDLFSKVI